LHSSKDALLSSWLRTLDDAFVSPGVNSPAELVPSPTGGKFVVADQKNRGQKQILLHLHSKQSRKLARSCFSWRFFAFHSTIYKLTVILLKIAHEFLVFGWFFCYRVIGRSEYGDVHVNMGVNTVYVELWLV
jgi:hypothetical protein